MARADLLQSACVVLKDVTHPGNIGAAARAMKTMGLSRLRLAAPKTLIDSQARAMSAGALDVLGDAMVCDGLPEAIADCGRVFAFSARRRDLSPEAVSVRQAARLAVDAMQRGMPAAFVFGGERSGLSNEDMERAGYAVCIPSSSAYWSLNLAQAVQIAAYELRLATFEGGSGIASPEPETAAPVFPAHPSMPPPRRRMPSQADMEMLFEHAAEFLADIGMPKRGDGRLLRARLRRLLTRAEPDASEVRMLRGLLGAARKHAAKPPH